MGEKGSLIPIYVVWSASYASAKTVERKGRISSSSFCEQLTDCY